MDRGGQEEARHDGRHRHRDAREDDDEVIGEGEVAAALSKTFLREQSERNPAAVQGERALLLLQAWKTEQEETLGGGRVVRYPGNLSAELFYNLTGK